MNNFANKVNNSETVEINSLAQQKAKAGVKVFNLSAGEPKMLPHPKISAAAVLAIKKGLTLYPPVSGVRELKTLAAAWMNKTYGAAFTEKNTLVVNGGKFGLYLLMQTLLQKGDEVLVPAPYWVSYPSITELFKGRVKFLATNKSVNWKITSQQVRNACSSKTRILILNSACNPTGVFYTKSELAKLLAVAKEKNLLVISDEVYSGLVYDGQKFASCSSFKQYPDRVIIIQSCSKSFAMTGWRIGFVFAPENLIANLTSLVSQSTSGVTTVSQWAAVAALKNSAPITSWVKQEMQKRRDVFLKTFEQSFRVKLAKPESAIYCFVSMEDLGIKSRDSVLLCRQALEKANVALTPGKAFGLEGFIRFSFGSKPEVIKDGIKALAKFCKNF